jgi:hypothetical protein
MKTTIIFVALVLFSFSLNSAEYSHDSSFEKNTSEVPWPVSHYIGTENGIDQYIELELPWEAALAHFIQHEKDLVCIPPCQPGR